MGKTEPDPTRCDAPTVPRLMGAARGLAVGGITGAILSFAAPASLLVLARPFASLDLEWALAAGITYAWFGIPCGAVAGLAARTLLPARYGRLWCLTTWVGATVGLLLGPHLFGGNWVEHGGQVPLPPFLGALGGAVIGFLGGARLLRSGRAWPGSCLLPWRSAWCGI
jgi:hypothetical protein